MFIKDAIALVTGANRGIGQQFVHALQNAGSARIYASARKLEAVTELAATDPNRIIPISLDITNPQSIQEAVARCQDVTLLINNAGVSFSQGLIAAPDLASARTEMEVNYFGTLAMCRAFAPVLKANGGGAIINLLSILSRVNMPMAGSYSASKAAALSLTQGIRAELAAQGTLVLAVMPAVVDTDMGKKLPLPKISPSQVAEAALQAVVEGVEEIYPGEGAKGLATQLASFPKAVEKQLANMLPNS